MPSLQLEASAERLAVVGHGPAGAGRDDKAPHGVCRRGLKLALFGSRRQPRLTLMKGGQGRAPRQPGAWSIEQRTLSSCYVTEHSTDFKIRGDVRQAYVRR